MSVTAATQPITSGSAPQVAINDIEVSCRAPVFSLLFSATIWFVIATALGLLASLKFHAPALLAKDAFWTYGRVHAAALDSFLYGFAVQAAIGVGLWLLCHLGRTTLVGGRTILFGLSFWNSAVLIGILAILWGDSSGFEAIELPYYVAPILFLSYVLMAICGALTFHARQTGPLYPSQWFVFGTLFWFPWIFSTAAMMLLIHPARGVVQVVIDSWYGQNFRTVFLGFAGLAPIFYFIPKLTGRTLYSAPLAAFALWVLAFFGSWGGIAVGSPLPVWLSTMSTIGTMFTFGAVLAVALNFYYTMKSKANALEDEPTLRFSYVALFFWIIASVQLIVGAIPSVSALTNLTWFTVAQKELVYYGFFTLSMMGAIYYIVPRLMRGPFMPSAPAADWDDGAEFCPKLRAASFWLVLLGVLAAYLALVVGGVQQGILLDDSRNSFMDVLRATLMAVRVSTLGDLLLFVGGVLLLLNFTKVIIESGKRWKGEFIPDNELRRRS